MTYVLLHVIPSGVKDPTEELTQYILFTSVVGYFAAAQYDVKAQAGYFAAARYDVKARVGYFAVARYDDSLFERLPRLRLQIRINEQVKLTFSLQVRREDFLILFLRCRDWLFRLF